VFRATTDPPQGILQSALDATEAMLEQGPFDLFDPDVHARFFRDLYRAVGVHGHDEEGIQALRAQLSFEQVADRYHLIDDAWSAPVVVPWDARALRAIDDLDRRGPSRARLRELQRVTVNVRKVDLARWMGDGAVRAVGDGTAHVLVGMSAYDRRFGLVPDHVGGLAPSDSVV
jgi:CRISPR-associated endonuclease/helicase Cas3